MVVRVHFSGIKWPVVTPWNFNLSTPIQILLFYLLITEPIFHLTLPNRPMLWFLRFFHQTGCDVTSNKQK